MLFIFLHCDIFMTIKHDIKNNDNFLILKYSWNTTWYFSEFILCRTIVWLLGDVENVFN